MSEQALATLPRVGLARRRQNLGLLLSFIVAFVGAFPYYLLFSFPLIASLAFAHASQRLRLGVAAVSAALVIVGIAQWSGIA